MFSYLLERQFSYEFLAEKHHPGDPEEQDIVSRL